MAPSDSFYLPVNYGFKQHNQFSLIRLSNEAKLVQEGGMERVPKWQSSGKAVWASCRESRGRRITTIGCGLALLDTNDTWRWSTTQIRKRSYTTLLERKKIFICLRHYYTPPLPPFLFPDIPTPLPSLRFLLHLSYATRSPLSASYPRCRFCDSDPFSPRRRVSPFGPSTHRSEATAEASVAVQAWPVRPAFLSSRLPV
jgi:hypothetical protein